MRKLLVCSLLLGIAALPAVSARATTASSAAGSSSTSTAMKADFNGDGRADMAVGVPFENVAGIDDGAVNVIYGAADGLSAAGNQFWSQDSPGILNSAEPGDLFGASVATGDFDGDGYEDLAVGVPKENHAATDDGGVNVIYGSPTGLTSAGNQFWSQNSDGIVGLAESGDRFGSALAAGDFNGDGREDLAVGVPQESYGATHDGGVNVIYGSAAGLTSAGNQFWSQDSPHVQGQAGSGEDFGYSLVAADFDGNGRDDLAVGVPFEGSGDLPQGAGGVNVIYGFATGLSISGNQFWTQDSPGIKDAAHEGDWFGLALAAGDFGDDGRADLAVGVPLEEVNGHDDGAVNVLLGAAGGLTDVGDQFWTQDDFQGMSESDDWFGGTLEAGDLDGDGHYDLAIGVSHGEDYASTDDGGVNVAYGSTFGLRTAGNQFWSQNSPGIVGLAEKEDHFGGSLAALDFDGDGSDDLAVAVAWENYGATDDGGVNVIYGSVSGLTSTGNQFWSQDSTGVQDFAENGDKFGVLS